MKSTAEHLLKISVITPTFNQGAFIEKTINSVLSQNYPNLEFIVIDGGSTDNTVEIVKKYEKHLTYWVSEPDSGQSNAINKGMALATGEILTWLNSDDWYLPGTLMRFAELFQQNPGIGVVVGAGRGIDSSGNEIYFDKPLPEITIKSLIRWFDGGNIFQPSCAFSRKAWEAIGAIDETIHIAMDLDLWLRMAKKGVKFYSTNELLSEALIHPNAKTTAYIDLTYLDSCLVIAEHGGKEYAQKHLTQMINRLAWYNSNYESIVNNPLLKFLRPIIKLLSKSEDKYWSDNIPPWVKE
jgi:glycosyltransferase involved in cell wall biosynthesis